MAILSGIHPVAEALRAGNPLDRILIAQGAGGPRLQEIIDLARRANVPVRFEPRPSLDRLAGTPAHQGVVALGAARKYADLDGGCAAQLLVVLDGVEDPHNLGAVIRTAHAAGAGAIIIPERRAAGLTDVVAKAAAGALEHLPVVRVTNINRALEELKQRGYLDLRPGRARHGVLRHGEVLSPDGARARRRGQGSARAGAKALRRAGAHPHGGKDFVAERLGGGRHRALRVEETQQKPHSRIEVYVQTTSCGCCDGRAAIYAVVGSAAGAGAPRDGGDPRTARHGGGARGAQSGGNAVDAAVAVGLALAVTHPSAGISAAADSCCCGLADGRTTFLDFRERAPRAPRATCTWTRPDKPREASVIGYRGMRACRARCAGWSMLAKKYGKKPWAELVHPAVELAAKGFPLSYGLGAVAALARARLARFPESNRIFLKDGKFYEAGETLVQPELARTLERMEKLGAKDFYEGETARLLAKDMAAHGGLITEADLKAYTVHERKPLTGNVPRLHDRHRAAAEFGRRGHSADARHAGRHGVREGRRRFGSAVHYMTEAMRRYFADRVGAHGRSRFRQGAADFAARSPKYIARQRASIDPERATPEQPDQGHGVRRERIATRPRITPWRTRKATSSR